MSNTQFRSYSTSSRFEEAEVSLRKIGSTQMATTRTDADSQVADAEFDAVFNSFLHAIYASEEDIRLGLGISGKKKERKFLPIKEAFLQTVSRESRELCERMDEERVARMHRRQTGVHSKEETIALGPGQYNFGTGKITVYGPPDQALAWVPLRNRVIATMRESYPLDEACAIRLRLAREFAAFANNKHESQ